MKAPKARRLKVFGTQVGFYDVVVAVPSQAAALEAWGVRQNLFADGTARVAQDADAIKAALDNPGVPLRRAIGSTSAFAVEPDGLPAVPDAPASPRAARPRTARPRAPERPPADRSALDTAEKRLKTINDTRKREEAGFRREEDDLKARQATAQTSYVKNRKAGTAAVVAARTAYRKAGGKD